MHTSRPNIVLITPHDLGTHIGCYGWDPALKTPTLDALAAQGTRFTNHFCTATFCSPSRGGIMTGKYPHVNGLMGLVNLGWDLPDGCDTLPDLLHADGYETVLFGFQHIVDDPARLPYDRIGPRGQYSCRQVAENVAAFLAERSAEEREAPLYLELGFSEVHRPYGRLERIDAPESEVVPLPFLDDTPGVRMDLAMFYENIRRLDDAVGSILQSLERAGMAENTVVVFTTDHGIAFPRAKSTLYDPGIRTTLLVRWPGVTDPGRICDSLVSNVDVCPTLLEAAGIDVPADLNGRSLLSLLRGETDEHRDVIFAEKNTQPDDIKRCVRTDRYKYIRNASEGPALVLPTDIVVTAAARDLGPESFAPRPPVELYDLSVDPWEQTNLAGTPETDGIQRDLSEMLERIMQETDDPLLDGTIPRPQAEAAIVDRIRSPQDMDRRRKNEDDIHAQYQALCCG
jgi:arylsulfatase A-like enzyme